MDKTRKIILGISLIALVFALAGCNLKPANITSNEPIKVGVILPLTGAGSVVAGEPLKKGIDLALAEINQNQKKIDVIYEDYQYDTKLALPAYNALKIKGVHYFIIDGSSAAAVLGPEVRKDNNWSMVPSAFLPSYKDGSPLTCRLALTAENYAPLFADLLYNKLNKKKVATLIPEFEAGIALENEFKKDFEKLGGQVVIEEKYLKDDPDFRGQLSKIKFNKDVEAILVLNYFQSVEEMFKQLKELDINVPIVSENWTIRNQSLKNFDLVNNVIFLDYKYSPDDQNQSKLAQNFISKFEKEYGTKPGLQSIQGYDSLKVLVYALDNINSKEPSDIANFMVSKIKNYDIAGGNITFNSDCEVQRDITIRKVENNKIIEYK